MNDGDPIRIQAQEIKKVLVEHFRDEIEENNIFFKSFSVAYCELAMCFASGIEDEKERNQFLKNIRRFLMKYINEDFVDK